jgi:hypothetical protein
VHCLSVEPSGVNQPHSPGNRGSFTAMAEQSVVSIWGLQVLVGMDGIALSLLTLWTCYKQELPQGGHKPGRHTVWLVKSLVLY